MRNSPIFILNQDYNFLINEKRTRLISSSSKTIYLTQALHNSIKLSAFNDAPPTRPPSILG